MARLRLSGRLTGRVLVVVAVVGALVGLIDAPAEAANPRPAPVVRVQANRTVQPMDPVQVAVYRVSSTKPVTVAWGDGTTTKISGGCAAAFAARHPFRCSARVQHAYREAGDFKIVVSRAPFAAFRTILHVAGAQAQGGSAPTAPEAAPPAAWQAEMLDAVNALRAKAGVPALTLCGTLQKSAQDYATLMAGQDYYGHVGPDGSQPWDRMTAAGYHWQGAAENIAAGFTDVGDVMTAWRTSPGHYANIINASFVHVGFGSSTNDSSTYGTYWVQHFGYGGSCS